MARGPEPGEILTALESSVHLIGPGDVVAVTFARALDDDEMDDITERLKAATGDTGIRWVVLDNGADVSVLRREDQA